jgi:hypothetical protein
MNKEKQLNIDLKMENDGDYNKRYWNIYNYFTENKE